MAADVKKKHCVIAGYENRDREVDFCPPLRGIIARMFNGRISEESFCPSVSRTKGFKMCVSEFKTGRVL